MPTSSSTWRLPRSLSALLAVASALLLLGACAPSAEQLERSASDQPGVSRVEAHEVEGDDALPFVTIPKDVTIWMDPDASAKQAMTALAAYDDDIDDDDLRSIDVIMDGPKQATLSLGEGIHGSQQLVDDLVAAQQDENVVEYRYEAYPVATSASVTLGDGTAADALAVAAHYDDADAVVVRVGDVVVSRDEPGGTLETTRR